MRKLWTLAAILVSASFLGLQAASAEDGHKKEGHKRPPIKQIFKKLDANSDGSISVKELVKSPRIDDKAKAKEILAKWDSNEDGKVSIKEFAKALKKAHGKHHKKGTHKKGDHKKHAHKKGDHKKGEHKKGHKRPPIKEIFKKLDANADGTLSAKELSASRHIDGEAKAKKVLAKWDSNRDGKISGKEFFVALKKIHGKHHKKGDKKECPSQK